MPRNSGPVFGGSLLVFMRHSTQIVRSVGTRFYSHAAIVSHLTPLQKVHLMARTPADRRPPLKFLRSIPPKTTLIAAFVLQLAVTLLSDATIAQVAATTAPERASQNAVKTKSETAFALRDQDPFPQAFYSGPTTRSEAIVDDAALSDVCAMGQYVWAVGDRGVVLTSSDSGQTWQSRILPFECSLSSVCFLTDQVGFIGGSVFDPFARQHQGIVLATTDRGESWRIISGATQSTIIIETSGRTQQTLPPISHIKFFDMENAVAISSHRTPDANSQVLKTDDGGSTWTALDSDLPRSAWTSGAFLSPDEGVLVGRGSSYGAIVSDQVVTLSQQQPVLRRMAAASISRNQHAWIVGDGAMLLHSDNGGISWKAPARQLPENLSDVYDFRSVDQRQNNVCIVGSPGNMIFTSNQQGAQWSASLVDSPAPLSCVRFIDDSTLVAVGALGIIHRSTDAGKTWSTVRNGNYRTAVLCLTTNPEDTSVRMLSSLSGDQGYRSVVVQPSGRLLPQKTDDGRAESIHSAVVQAGASGYECDWMFSRNQRMHDRVRSELMSTWGQQTDGRVGEMLPTRLAKIIRTWRPDVICVETSGPNDQLSQLLLQALQTGVRFAANTADIGGSSTLNQVKLQPWAVKRIYTRLVGKDQSPIRFGKDDLLPNAGTTIGLLADYCIRQAGTLSIGEMESGVTGSAPHSYQAWNGHSADATPAFLMAGIPTDPSSANRRIITPNPNADRSSLEQLVQQQQVELSAITGQTQSTTAPLALIASVKRIGANLPAALAMKQLQYLANLYAEKENLDGEIEVLKEIVTRFPNLPESADAAEKLFQYYSSSELRMLRRREGNGDTSDVSGALKRIPGVMTGDTSIRQTSGTKANGILKAPIEKAGTGTALWNNNGSANSAVDQQWDRNAEMALSALQRLSPTRASSPRIVIRQAANILRSDAYGQNRTLLSKASSGDGLYSFLAKAEMQGEHGLAETPIPVINIKPTEQKPFLDSNLDEDCWQDAIEIRLTDSKTNIAASTPDCLVMLTWDDEYVYLAGRIEKSRLSTVVDPTAERHHDSSHNTNDRIEFVFDIDRDYTTGFHFTVDESGQTSERCWSKKNWNPEWHVASGNDGQAWRFEAAIPQKELLPNDLRAGALWAVQIRRLVPGVREQALIHPDKPPADPNANGYGMLRFIRNRNR